MEKWHISLLKLDSSVCQQMSAQDDDGDMEGGRENEEKRRF